MQTRKPKQLNYQYINRLFAALDQLGVDPADLPRGFIHAAWEDKAAYLLSAHNLPFCPRCKMPKSVERMDFTYSMCVECARNARMLYRSKQDLDPRALAIIEENAEMSERKPFMLRRSGDLELRDAVTKLKAIHDRRVAEQSAPETPNVDDSKCEAPTKPKDCSVNAILNAGRK